MLLNINRSAEKRTTQYPSAPLPLSVFSHYQTCQQSNYNQLDFSFFFLSKASFSKWSKEVLQIVKIDELWFINKQIMGEIKHIIKAEVIQNIACPDFLIGFICMEEKSTSFQIIFHYIIALLRKQVNRNCYHQSISDMVEFSKHCFYLLFPIHQIHWKIRDHKWISTCIDWSIEGRKLLNIKFNGSEQTEMPSTPSFQSNKLVFCCNFLTVNQGFTVTRIPCISGLWKLFLLSVMNFLFIKRVTFDFISNE